MNHGHPKNDERLEMLVNHLLNEQLDARGALELRERLLSSRECRAYYQQQVDLHSQMMWLLRDHSEGEEVETSLQETRALFRRTRSKVRTFALACIPVLLLAAGVILMTNRAPLPSKITTADNRLEQTSTSLGHASNLKWHQDSSTVTVGEELEPTTYHLLEGFLRLDIGPGSQVFIEAPCRFEPIHEMLLKVHEGRINAEVNEQGHGFTVWTPAGKFIDLGTRFGIGVGTDESGNDVILSEVFTGEVKVEPRNRKPDATETITEGDTLGLLGRLSFVDISKTVDDRPIKLSFSRYEETSAIERYRAQDAYNLAYGKPVKSTSTYVGTNGEVFPASNLTDGRINDTGFPGNWSFWLASNEAPVGEIVIDLEEAHTLDCLQLLNTHNRYHRDRGTKDFTFLTSDDGRKFTKIISGTLDKLESPLSAGGQPAIETFTFPALSARYLKLKIHSFYRAPTPSTSAGLNEIRIFGPELPDELRTEMLTIGKTTAFETK